MAKNGGKNFLDDFQKQTKGLTNLTGEKTVEEKVEVEAKEIVEEVKENKEEVQPIVEDNTESVRGEQESEVDNVNPGINIQFNIKAEQRTARKQVCLTPSLAKTAEKFCKKNNISFNELINQLLEIYFKQQN